MSSKKAASMLDLMRDSPLVALRGRAVSKPRAGLWGKLELALPGAMKDRVALNIIERAEAAGALRPGACILESSSGTLAEGIARVGAVKGYRVIIVTDPRIDTLTHNKLRALGAEVDVVETYHPTGGWQLSRLERLRQLLQQHPDAFWTRQYDNPDNAGAYDVLARELVDALGDGIGALVGSVGSGGSLCGTARALRRLQKGRLNKDSQPEGQAPEPRIVAVDATGSLLFHQPAGPRLQSGHGNNVVAGNLDYRQIDEVHWLNDSEAFLACGELARREGIFAGGSSGAVYVAASWLAEQLPEGRHVVALLPDRGDRYSDKIYDPGFLAEHALHTEAPASPSRIRYGVDVAQSWSWAPLPHDGSIPYCAPEAGRTGDLTSGW